MNKNKNASIDTSIANTNIQINKKAIIVVYGSNFKKNL